jgi:hypothetical protein
MKLTIEAAFDQSRISKNLQMVRDCPRSDPLKSADLAAIHLFPRGNGLEDTEAGVVSQGFRNPLNLRAIHSCYDARPRGRSKPKKVCRHVGTTPL